MRRTRPLAAWACVLLVGACSVDGPTGVDEPGLLAARGGSGEKGSGGSGGSTGPSVTATDPRSSPAGTTLDVRVLGSGFDNGSVVEFQLDEQPAPALQTNATRFVNKRELVATLTISPAAAVDLYDVAVTTSRGKRGVGIELFEVSYAVTELGTLGGGSSQAHAINDRGEVVGTSELPGDGGYHVFFWADGVMEDVGVTGTPNGLSDNGRVVGLAGDGWTTAWRPAIWEKAGTTWTQTLLEVTGPDNPWANGINPQGTRAVGGSENLPLVWTENAGQWTYTVLPMNGNNGYPFDINRFDQVAGQSGTRAVAWTLANGAWTLHLLPRLAGEVLGWAWAINDAGDVVGYSQNASFVSRPVVWRRNATGWDAPIDLGSSEIEGEALSVNSQLEVVGFGGPSGAFVWRPSTGIAQLHAPRTYISAYARDINDSGQLVGYGRKPSAGGQPANGTGALLWTVR
jgi:probable HAF family extracellular repeat protein